jgi:hypothetical protein
MLLPRGRVLLAPSPVAIWEVASQILTKQTYPFLLEIQSVLFLLMAPRKRTRRRRTYLDPRSWHIFSFADPEVLFAALSGLLNCPLCSNTWMVSWITLCQDVELSLLCSLTNFWFRMFEQQHVKPNQWLSA